MIISDLPTGSPASTAITAFASSPAYRRQRTPYVVDNPYLRPLDCVRLAGIDWAVPLRQEEFGSDSCLLANRLLMNIYESDAVFLPADGLLGRERDFEAFYATESKRHADLARPTVEAFTLGFLEDAGPARPDLEPDAVQAYLERTIDDAVHGELPVFDAIEAADEPERAAEMLIAQMAPDGLTEATAMSMNLGGTFGPEQSELFKIFIDEFGYGVFAAKHSTLFTDLCRSTGMDTRPHHYWFFYLPGSMAANNYFYLVSRNHTGFFRYIGAMALLEATFASWFARLSDTLRKVYGAGVDTRYCDEHAHIDVHHGRMAVHDLLLPLVRKHGPIAARGVLRGVEEVRRISALADAELLAQLAWRPEPRAAAPVDTAVVHELGADSPFDTAMADGDTSVDVLSGTVHLYRAATGEPLTLPAGRGLTVPDRRLFGLRADTDAAVALGPAR